VTDAQRSYLTNLLRIGRATLHALERAIRYETRPRRLGALAAERDAVRADVARLETVLGV
jgi:hypothetical protein